MKNISLMTSDKNDSAGVSNENRLRWDIRLTFCSELPPKYYTILSPNDKFESLRQTNI